MPRTKKPTEKTSKPSRETAGRNGPTSDVLTLREAAAYLQLSEFDVLRLVHEQGLPARQLGSEWRLLKAAIQDWLRSGPQPTSNKEAWMALAGAWKDDPFREDMLKEIYRQRGRPMTEDES